MRVRIITFQTTHTHRGFNSVPTVLWTVSVMNGLCFLRRTACGEYETLPDWSVVYPAARHEVAPGIVSGHINFRHQFPAGVTERACVVSARLAMRSCAGVEEKQNGRRGRLTLPGDAVRCCVRRRYVTLQRVHGAIVAATMQIWIANYTHTDRAY